MRFFLSALLSALLTASVAFADPTPLGGLTIMQDRHPRSLFFWTVVRDLGNQAYSVWPPNINRLQGSMAQALPLYTNPNPVNGPNMNLFATQHPDQIVLLHANSYARRADFQTTRYSAGHFVHFPGCVVTGNVSATDTLIPIASNNAGRFRLQNLDPAAPGGQVETTDDIVIVALDGNGNKLWATAEQVKLVAITPAGLEVQRARYGTTALSFTANQAWVAAHAYEGPRDGQLAWLLNYAAVRPEHPGGARVGDVLAAEFTEWFASTGPLANFHGVCFDVSKWKPEGIENTIYTPKRRIDLDNNGVADSGVLGPINVYAQGLLHKYTALRAAMGPTRLLLADGQNHSMQRAAPALNGIEAEAFTDNVDPLQKDWAGAINRLQFWQQQAGAQPRFNYIAHKLRQLQDPLLAPSLTRLTHGAAASLGVGVTQGDDQPPVDAGLRVGIYDELRRGDERIPAWLGAPLGPMTRLATSAPDILGGIGVASDAAFVAGWTSSNATVVKDGAEMKITGTTSDETMQITYANLTVPAQTNDGDLFVSFRVRCAASPGFPAEVPRVLTVRLPGSFAYVNTEADVSSWMNGTPFTASFYFRRAGQNGGNPTRTISMQIECEGAGDVWLSEFTVRNAADLIVRPFEQGVVLCNPSAVPQSFPLATLFPGQVFRRLTATTGQDTTHNDGTLASSTISVNTLDAYFLERVLTPVVDFTAAPAVGVGPTLAVNFTDASQGAPTAWQWDILNDGSIESTSSTTAFHFTHYGVYPAKLTATNLGGPAMLVRPDAVVVGKPRAVSDAQTGYSSTQGANQWHYLEWDGATYHPLPTWDGTLWRDNTTEVKLWNNSDAPGAMDSARAWQAAQAGWVAVTGRVRKFITGGEGVRVSIHHNAALVWGPQDIAAADTTGFTYHVSRAVVPGDRIYFRVNQKANNNSDRTAWDPVVSFILADDVDYDALSDAWELAHFPTINNADIATDTDGDSLADGFEHLFGTAPTAPSPTPLRIRRSGGASILTYSRRAGLPLGIETLEATPHLHVAWTPLTGAAFLPTLTPGAAGEPHTAEITIPDALGHRFFRLRVTAP